MNHIVPKKTIKDHIDNGNPEVQNMYSILRPWIKEINKSIREYPTNPYIGFNLFTRNTLFVEVHIQNHCCPVKNNN